MLDLRKLKICFLAGTLGRGGAEQQLYYMLKALRDVGAQPEVLCLTNGEHWQERIEALGVPLTWVGKRSGRSWRLAQIIAKLRSNPPHIIQSQHFYTNIYASLTARALRAHEIGAMRNDGNSEVAANGKILGSLSLRLPRLLAANSQLAINNAISMGVPAKRLQLLPNAVDTRRFGNGAREAKEHLHVVAVGRLVPQKRFDLFLDVIARAGAQSPLPIKATIVGDGPQRAQLEKRAAELNLFPGRIKFAGSVPDVSSFYGHADVLVLTSEYEGTPNVVLEAMASGLPVIATRIGGVPDIVREGTTGFLAEFGDVDAIVRVLLKLAQDSSLRERLGAESRRYVEAAHSVDNLSTHLARIYERAFQ